MALEGVVATTSASRAELGCFFLAPAKIFAWPLCDWVSVVPGSRSRYGSYEGWLVSDFEPRDLSWNNSHANPAPINVAGIGFCLSLSAAIAPASRMVLRAWPSSSNESPPWNKFSASSSRWRGLRRAVSRSIVASIAARVRPISSRIVSALP